MKNQAVKEALWKLVDEEKSELLQICADLIKIPSVTPAQCESILEHVTCFLSDCSISYQVVRGPDEMPSIIAEVGEEEGPVAIIDGHNDVVCPGDLSKWRFSPYCGTITDTQILGRGTSDMKCGVGLALFIAKKIKEKKLKLKGKLRLFIVHDEEAGGEKGSMYLIEHGYADDCSFCLIPEPTSYNYVEVGQKGSVRMKVVTHGTPVNGSIINYVGKNAIHEMMRFLSKIDELCEMDGIYFENQQQVLLDSKRIIRECFDEEGVENAIDRINLNLMDIDGGTSNSMTPEVCTALVGMLVPVGIKTEDIVKKVQEICEREGITDIEITYPRLKDGACTDVDTPLVRSTVANATEIKGETVYPAYQWATSDAKFFRYHNIPAIQYGPANSLGIHSYNEDVEIKDILDCTKVYFGVLEDLIGFEADTVLKTENQAERV